MKAHSKPSGVQAPKVDRLTATERQFVQEKSILKSVTPKTQSFYEQTFISFSGCTSKALCMQRIVEMRGRGVKPVSINHWITGFNTYQHWLVNRDEQAPGYVAKCNLGCTHLKLSKLKYEDKILETFSVQQLRLLLNYKVQGENERRIQVMAALLVDTGLRIDEARNLKQRDVDLQKMEVKVMGKGRKERTAPLSQEGRRWLYLWLRTHPVNPQSYVFRTGTGTAISVRNAERDLHALGETVGITGVRCSPHTLRHTFAVQYLMANGNLEYLRRILGHTTIQITQRYLRSLPQDAITEVHGTFSPLGKVS